MYLRSDHRGYAFVQVAEAGGEAALVEKADIGDERVVKRCCESFELLLGWIWIGDIVEPVTHERTQELTNSFGRRGIHLCDPANDDALIELTSAAPCSPVDVASQDVLEVKSGPTKDLGVEVPRVIDDDDHWHTMDRMVYRLFGTRKVDTI